MQFSEIPELLRINGEALAKATAEYEFMEDMLKTELALCAPPEGSEASKEREARKHQNYRKAAEGKREARHEMLRLRTEREAQQAAFDYFRSMNSNARAERQNY